VEAGDMVVAELFPDREDAVLVEVFGADDDPRMDDLAVASRHRLARAFSRAAEQEAALFGEPVFDASTGRLDLRDRVTFTMDPVDARDFDDALSWRPARGGMCEVGIHIADVAHYVRAGGALDEDARERATSVYLAGGVVPMLPHELSSDLCSLVPGQGRFTMSVLAEMDGRGGVTRYRLAEGFIESRARLSYQSGQAILDGDAAAARRRARRRRARAWASSRASRSACASGACGGGRSTSTSPRPRRSSTIRACRWTSCGAIGWPPWS
jgi:VacB/RNase II family 3'-5' exoribonuclease